MSENMHKNSFGELKINHTKKAEIADQIVKIFSDNSLTIGQSKEILDIVKSLLETCTVIK